MLNQTIQILQEESKGDIKDVLLVDLNDDGHLDLVVLVGDSSNYQLIFMFRDPPKSTPSLEDQSLNEDELFDVKDVVKMDVFKHHPQVYQEFDDEIGSLKTYMIVQKTENNRVVIHVNKSQDGSNLIQERPFKEIMSTAKGCRSPDEVKFNKLHNDFGGAFIDLNMDCRPDLLIEGFSQHGRVHEIYFYTDDGFCLVDVNPVSSDWSHVSFVDLDTNGSNDAVFMDGGLKLHLFLNRYSLEHSGILAKLRTSLCEDSGDKTTPFVKYSSSENGKVRLFFLGL